MLSAAAIALCPNVSMVPSIAGDIAKVAFRFGLVVDQVCRSLEISPDVVFDWKVSKVGSETWRPGAEPHFAHPAVPF